MASAPSSGTQLPLAGRLVRDLGPFSATMVDTVGTASRLRTNLARNEQRFLGFVERAVFGLPDSSAVSAANPGRLATTQRSAS